MEIIISKSERCEACLRRPGKKLKAVIDNKKAVHFGQAGASDYLQHKDPERRERYIKRHEKRERHLWGKDGIDTPSWWSRHLLWGTKENLRDAINDINKKFNINAKIK